MSEVTTSSRAAMVVLIAVVCVIDAVAQHPPAPADVPPNFHADTVFAGQVRGQIVPLTQPAAPRFPAAAAVFERLVRTLPPTPRKFDWQLRLAPEAGNIFSSPDGVIFIDENLAEFLGSQSGLWAAALSHEIQHIFRRDWARRYLYQKALEASASGQISLGDASAATTYTDARASAALLDNFCQSQELEADSEGLHLMARAGYHPAFMPALYHVLQAQPHQLALADATHPHWDDRTTRLRDHFTEAAIEFDRLWPEAYQSPGGNPPILVFAGKPLAHRTPANELEILVPLHCDNLYGSVEVVLKVAAPNLSRDLRQITGCTSDRTLLTFTLTAPDLPSPHSLQATVSILDDRGELLTRAFAPKLQR